MEKSWVTELQEDYLCQEIVQFISLKKQAGTFYITYIMCRFVRSFSCVILFLFLKEDVKLEKFQCLPFFI